MLFQTSILLFVSVDWPSYHWKLSACHATCQLCCTWWFCVFVIIINLLYVLLVCWIVLYCMDDIQPVCLRRHSLFVVIFYVMQLAFSSTNKMDFDVDVTQFSQRQTEIIAVSRKYWHKHCQSILDSTQHITESGLIHDCCETENVAVCYKTNLEGIHGYVTCLQSNVQFALWA